MKCLCLSTSAGWEVGKVRSGVKGGFLFFIIHLEVMKESAHRYSFFFLSYIDFCFFQLCIMLHHFFFFLYNNGISFTIILVEVEVRTLNVMWQYIEIGAPACPHHRTLSTSCGSQLGISIPVGAVCALAPPSLEQLLRARTMYTDTQARVKCEPVTQLGHLGAFSCKD